MPQSKFLISFLNVPYHQLPEIMIGFLPCSKALPMSWALMPESFLM